MRRITGENVILSLTALIGLTGTVGIGVLQTLDSTSSIYLLGYLNAFGTGYALTQLYYNCATPENDEPSMSLTSPPPATVDLELGRVSAVTPVPTSENSYQPLVNNSAKDQKLTI